MNLQIPVKSSPQKPLNLSCVRCGESFKIVGLTGNTTSATRLRELGFCESTEVRKVCDGSAMICHLLGTRVAIGRELGTNILVEPLRH